MCKVVRIMYAAKNEGEECRSRSAVTISFLEIKLAVEPRSTVAVHSKN